MCVAPFSKEPSVIQQKSTKMLLSNVHRCLHSFIFGEMHMQQQWSNAPTNHLHSFSYIKTKWPTILSSAWWTLRGCMEGWGRAYSLVPGRSAGRRKNAWYTPIDNVYGRHRTHNLLLRMCVVSRLSVKIGYYSNWSCFMLLYVVQRVPSQ